MSNNFQNYTGGEKRDLGGQIAKKRDFQAYLVPNTGYFLLVIYKFASQDPKKLTTFFSQIFLIIMAQLFSQKKKTFFQVCDF